MRVKWVWICAIAVGVIAAPAALYALPMGTAFTYQGQLKDGGIPASDDYDFEFALWDAEVGGNQVGPLVSKPGWPVEDGLFSVTLDFGEGVFTSEARWLEIVVNGTTLSPRQELTPTAYALYALDGPGVTGYWSAAGDNIYNNNAGNVGIGTTSPLTALHVNGSLHLEGTGQDISVPTNQNLQIGNFDGTTFTERVTITNTGCVGIGTINPLTALHVSGSLHLQGTGEDISVPTGEHFQIGEFDGDTYTEWLHIDSAGNVGIGTTSPSYPLHVVSSGADVVYGESSVSGGVGLRGKASSFEGGGFGVRGDSYGPTGFGVFGIAAMTTGINYGVYGQSQSQTGGRGVYGLGASGTGVNYGVYGQTNSADGWAGYFTGGRSYFGGDVGIGTDSPDHALDVAGLAFVDTLADVGWIGTRGPNGQLNTQTTHILNYPNNGLITVADSTGMTRAAMYVQGTSTGVISADIKNFRVPNPGQPGTDIWYACVEGPEAAAYIRGTAHLVDGRANVTFPDHFTAVATSQGMTVQITPHSAESKGLAVVERSIEGFVVRELFSGVGTYDFDYTVMAVRQGHEDYRVIRPSTEGLPAGEVERRGADRIADREVR